MKPHYVSAAVLSCLALGACASPDPVAYRDIASASQLRSNPDSDGGRIPYRYSTNVNWHSYDKILLDNVDIYRGSDAQFGSLSEDDKEMLANYMAEEFGQKLSKHFRMVDAPEPGALRIKLSLTGADTNTPVLSTATRFDISGGLYNGVQAVRGREGMMSGSVLYAVEIYDAASNRLLDAAVVKQYPGAYNIGASIGALAAAKVGIEKGADALVEQLNQR